MAGNHVHFLTPAPARPARPSNPRDRLRGLKQLLIDRFSYFRLDLGAFANYDAEGRRHIRQNIPIPPNQGPWPGHPRERPRQAVWPIHRPGALARMLPRGGRDATRRLAADKLAETLKRDFKPARFRFRRRLGYGGFGAAFLFEMSDEDGHVLPVVVKADISGRQRSGEMHKEKENFVFMAGAQHFVQRCVLQAYPLPGRPARTMDKLKGLFTGLRLRGDASEHDDGLVEMSTTPEQVHAARKALDRRRDIIIMEYMSRGNLRDLIAKLQGREGLSDRMLWLIFECLFKACIAMAYPLRFCPEDMDPWSELVVPQEETAPSSDRLPVVPLVHFDLDPQNALIGDFGLPDGSHSSVPIVKVADPGLSEIVDSKFRRNEWKLWMQRANGKPDFFTPEQFTPEWDYEASRGLYELSRQETAGNYQWWSNLFQVGWIMWCLITHCSPPNPPAAQPYSYPAEDGSNATVSGHSYGLILYGREFMRFDRSLRLLIARCLDHNATRRPNMRYMERVIAANVDRMDLRGRESDEALTRNARRIFGGPP